MLKIFPGKDLSNKNSSRMYSPLANQPCGFQWPPLDVAIMGGRSSSEQVLTGLKCEWGSTHRPNASWVMVTWVTPRQNDRQIDTYENITFPQLIFSGGNDATMTATTLLVEDCNVMN